MKRCMKFFKDKTVFKTWRERFVFLSENVIALPKLIHKFNRLPMGDTKGKRR